MDKKNKNPQYNNHIFLIVISVFIFIYGPLLNIVVAEEEDVEETQNSSVELNGDVVQYSQDGNVLIAEGNVVVVQQNSTLYCDKVEFARDSQVAYAEGNVRLVTAQGEISGSKMTYNFKTMEGTLNNAKIFANPYYGFAKVVHKHPDNKMVLEDGYLTTSDYDKPEYRIVSKKMDVYPGDKIVARHSTLRVGDAPLAYIPYFRQKLTRKKPVITFTPGHDDDFGGFLLTEYNWWLNEYLQGTVHLDYRELRDVASGLDVAYKTEGYGEGLIRTYYMNERTIDADRIWDKRRTPTKERERFKAEWRHKWKIDSKTNAIWQYYKLSDGTLLNDYFEDEDDEDGSPDSFAVVTRILPVGVLSLRIDDRVNRFESKLERLPELRYDLVNQEIADTGLFFRNKTVYSNLSLKQPSPSENRLETMRVLSDNEMSYPFKLGFLEFKPFVGSEHTYYSKTNNPEKYGSVRAIFRTGTTLNTKFYRLFDVDVDSFALKIKKLRHIITPSVDYRYGTYPTLDNANLDAFDGVDSRNNVHTINFALENKLQTKRKGNSVDLLRFILSAPYPLKENPTNQGFSVINSDVDFRPVDWLSLYFDSSYDTNNSRLSTANFDVYVNGGEKWRLGVSKRFDREVDDLLTSNFEYIFNQKWMMRTYFRFDLAQGEMKEQNYTLVRDLHTWEMEANLNDKIGEGTEVVVYFRLKAFPTIGFDFGKKFEPRNKGSDNF